MATFITQETDNSGRLFVKDKKEISLRIQTGRFRVHNNK